MAIITISKGYCSHGQEIAQQVAECLNYTWVDHEDIVLQAATAFHIPEEKLLATLHDAPGVLERITGSRKKSLEVIQAALLTHARKDNLVYSGYAGHVLLPEVGHLLKIRVNADLEERVRLLQKRQGIDRGKALEFIRQEDRDREVWTQYFCHVDLNYPLLYDMILHVGHLSIDDCVEIIRSTAQAPSFYTTPQSRQAVEDLAITGQVKAAIKDICEADVKTRAGIVQVKVHPPEVRKTAFMTPHVQDHLDATIREDLTEEIVMATESIPGVKQVICDVKHVRYF